LDRHPALNSNPADANYANYKSFGWRLWFNPNVNLVNVGIQNWDIETNYDYMDIVDRFGTTKLTGNISPGWQSSHFTLPTIASNRPGSYLDFDWHTDSSVNKSVPLIDKIRVKCSGNYPTTNTKNVLAVNKRHEGILISAGDVIYFTSVQPASRRMVLSLDHLSTQVGADFDLYASTTTTMPNATNHQWASLSSSASESIILEPTGADRVIYWGVRSFSGNGHFAVHVNLQSSSSPSEMTVCTPLFTIPPQDRPFFTELLREATLRFFSATQGNIWFKSWHVNQGLCTNTCNLCLIPNDVTGCLMYGLGTNCKNVEHMAPCVWKNSQGYGLNILGKALAHEYGHTCFSRPDEYDTGLLKSWCGHSLMGINAVQVTSDYISSQFCTDRDHCKDPTQYNGVCSSQGSIWGTIHSSPYINFSPHPNRTPYSTQFIRNQSLRNKITVSYY
jgi:hypothetical protein